MSFTYHPTTFLDAEVSVFKNVKATTPMKTITYRDWVFSTDKDLRHEVEKIRAEKCLKKRQILKRELLCITGSGVIINNRSDNNLKEHNGYILVDIDYKDNRHLKKDFFKLKEKVFSKIDEVCYAGLSVSGQGYYLIIRLENPKRHIQYFHFISNWFKDSEDINIDGSCVNMSRLRLFSIDDNPYINEQAKVLKESLLIEVKKPSIKVENSNTDIDKLVNKIEASGISIAPNYEDYLKLAIVFYNELGEGGRNYFHRVCCLDSKYNSKDCDNLYDDISKRNYTNCTLGTLIFLMQQSNII